MTALAFRAPRSGLSVVRSLAVLAVAALAVLGFQRVGDLLPSLPFGSETVDRSAPAVLHALADVSRYEAAQGNYSVIVDIESDTRWVPSFIRGERTVLAAQGSVAAHVDMSAPDVVVDGESVTVRLPTAEVGEARIDMEESRIVSRSRGLLDRLGSVVASSPGNDGEMLAEAQRRLHRAASADRGLVDRAEANTVAMLKRLLAPLGFEQVRVEFG